jgi:hypothetical protein
LVDARRATDRRAAGRSSRSHCLRRADGTKGQRSRRAVGGQGIRHRRLRQDPWDRGASPEIPTKRSRKVQYSVDKTYYAMRFRIECGIGRLKEQRRINTRFDKTISIIMGFVTRGCVRLWLGSSTGPGAKSPMLSSSHEFLVMGMRSINFRKKDQPIPLENRTAYLRSYRNCDADRLAKTIDRRHEVVSCIRRNFASSASVKAG